MLERKKKPFILIMFLFITLFIMQTSYALFDDTISYNPIFIQVGQWTIPATVSNVTNAINDAYSDNPNLQNYLNDLFFVDNGGVTELDPVFSNYTLEEINETMENVELFSSNFLTFTNGSPSFKTSGITPITYSPAALNPGEHLFIHQLLLTPTVGLNQSLFLSVKIFSDKNNGIANENNISDYSVEILVDKNALAPSSPYEYSYYYYREGSTKELATSKIQAQKNILAPHTLIQYNTTVINSGVTTLYAQSYGNPAFTGVWCRHPIGPRISLATPATWTVNKTFEDPGLYAPGSGDGSFLQMVTQFTTMRNPYMTVPKVIPLTLVLSRGVSNNGTNLPLTNVPKIEITVYR